MSRLVTPMIIYKEKEFFMKRVFCRISTCSNYGRGKEVPINQPLPRCSECKAVMGYKWVSLGSKLDPSQYFSAKSKKAMIKGKNYDYR